MSEVPMYPLDWVPCEDPHVLKDFDDCVDQDLRDPPDSLEQNPPHPGGEVKKALTQVENPLPHERYNPGPFLGPYGAPGQRAGKREKHGEGGDEDQNAPEHSPRAGPEERQERAQHRHDAILQRAESAHEHPAARRDAPYRSRGGPCGEASRFPGGPSGSDGNHEEGRRDRKTSAHNAYAALADEGHRREVIVFSVPPSHVNQRGEESLRVVFEKFDAFFGGGKGNTETHAQVEPSLTIHQRHDVHQLERDAIGSWRERQDGSKRLRDSVVVCQRQGWLRRLGDRGAKVGEHEQREHE